MKEIEIIENRSEIGAGTRGASLGIDALKVASLNLKSDYFANYKLHRIADQNELLWVPIETPSARRLEGIAKVYDDMADLVDNIASRSNFPLVLAADHASAGGTIAGIKKAYPNKRLGVIWVDAHADLHSPFTSPTGNVHGMPLATALAEDNLQCKVKEPKAKALQFWEQMKDCGGVRPKLKAEDLIFFGVRDTEKPEQEFMKRKSIRNYTVEECRNEGIDSLVDDALNRLKDCDMIYISFDVDSMDPDLVSYGTGTPVKNGFSSEEALDILSQLIEKSKKVACFEMVEVNPTLDHQGNKMAETAFKILEALSPKLSEYGI